MTVKTVLNSKRWLSYNIILEIDLKFLYELKKILNLFYEKRKRLLYDIIRKMHN